MRSEVKQRLLDEIKTALMLAAYLALFFWGFTVYRNLILEEYKITPFHYWFSLLQALVLAKIVLIGRFFGLGERFERKPIVLSVLYKTLSFSFLVLAFEALEHVVHALVRNEAVPKMFSAEWAGNRDEILARMLVMFIAFVPLFAIFEVVNRSGNQKLFELFFTRPGRH